MPVPSATLTPLTIAISLAGVTIALFGAIIATASFRTARISLHNSRTALLAQIRAEWVKLHDDWTISIALAQGPRDYYSGASAEQRDALRKLARDVAGTPENDISTRQKLVFSYGQHVKRVTEILDLCATLALQGRLRIPEVYTILGLDVARHANSVRWPATAVQGQSLWVRRSSPTAICTKC
jgi:hypothetical protein